MSFIAAGVSLGTAAISTVVGLSEKAKAKRLAEQNVRPNKPISPEMQENVQLAKGLANQGMPAQQYTQAKQNIQQNQAATLNAAMAKKGGAANVGAIQAQTNQALSGLDTQSAAMRVQNVQNLMHQNQALAGEKEKAWQWNSAMKYEENAAAIRALNTAGNANINQAISQAGSAAGYAAQGLKTNPNASQVGTNTQVGTGETIQQMNPQTQFNTNFDIRNKGFNSAFYDPNQGITPAAGSFSPYPTTLINGSQQVG